MDINWLLFIVIVILGGCIYHGWRCGLIRMLFSIATFIITIVIVRLLAPVGVQMLKSNETVYEGIKQPIVAMLDEKVDGKISTDEVLKSCNMSEETRQKITDNAKSFGLDNIEVFTPEVKGVTADYITLRIIDLLAYVIFFIIVNIALRVVGIILQKFSKLPVIREANKLGGAAFGILEGITCVWLFFAVVTIFSTAAWGSWCLEMIEKSVVLSWIYTNNIFLFFV